MSEPNETITRWIDDNNLRVTPEGTVSATLEELRQLIELTLERADRDRLAAALNAAWAECDRLAAALAAQAAEAGGGQ